ncbi:TniQ family protein [Roseinatronobacter sp. S2]|uniref:TniQ family protein n=1 Tax=Roseinatronobacter sp. S2 TaxID=3035471 RepID=UPI00240F7DD3|nr:TniQ family protein [Roseinatronobacter sp. S2]WFE75236.1 TniQ family protein [Roseinatronobacter sp. S2]
MTRLALNLKPQKDETIMSFVSRLAAKNGPSCVQDFCLDLGLNWRKLIYSDDAELSKLATLTGIDESELMPMALVEIDRRRCLLHGQLVASRSFLRSEQKLCPACVHEDKENSGTFGVFGRREWMLTSFRICPIHSCQLVTLPTAVFPHHPCDFFRRYEAGYGQTVGQMSESGTSQSSIWECYLRERLSGIIGDRWIDQFDLDAAMRIAQNFGVLLAHGSSAREAKLSQAELSQACHAGFVATSEGVGKVVSAMTSVYEKSPSKAQGFFTDFGLFSRWCARVFEDERYAPMIDVFTQFAFENYPVSTGDTIYGRVCKGRKWHNCSSAAEEFGGTAQRISKIVEILGLGEKRPGKDRIFRAEDAKDALPDLLRCIPRIQCIHRLGIAGSLFDRLVQRKFIQPKYDLPNVAPLYDPDEIDGFMSSARENTRLVSAPSKGVLDLKTVCSAAACFTDEVLTQVLAGNLKEAEWVETETGLGALRFKLEDVRDALEVEPIADLTKNEVRSALCVNAPTVKMLIDSNKLKSTVSRHTRSRRPRRVVKRSEVDKFLVEYVSLGELAKKEGIQANWVAAKLARDNIFPIDLPSEYSKLYIRSTIEA